MESLVLPSNYRFREYCDGDEVAINAAFNRVFQLRRTLDEWEWKYRPDGCRPTLLTVTNDSREIIAHYGAMAGLSVQCHKKRFKAAQAVDVFCLRTGDASHHRFYVQLVVEFLQRFGGCQGFPLFYGFPNQKALRLARLKAGYPQARSIQVMTCRVERKLLPWRPCRVPPAPPASAVDHLWDRAADRYPVSLVRDSAWLRRRFSSHPSQRYLHLTVQDCEGLAAWGVFLRRGRTIFWVDLVWDGRSPSSLIGLHQKAQRLGLAWGARRMLMWLENDAEAREVLQGQGWTFDRSQAQTPFVALAFEASLNHEEFMDRCYLTMAAGDHV